MIKFPEYKETSDDDETICSLKAAVNAGMVGLGQRYMIEGNPITCVDIEDGKYIFSMDEIYKCAAHKEIQSILQSIYETGKIDDIEVLPVSMMKDIDFLFVPSEFQVFGKNKYGVDESGEKQFEWYKRGDAVRVKGYRGKSCREWEQGETLYWWLCTVSSGYSTNCCLVTDDGNANATTASHTTIGVPVFLQITKDGE